MITVLLVVLVAAFPERTCGDTDSESDRDRVNKPSVATSGRSCDMVDLGLPGVLVPLVEHIYETGTPVVVSGKPHSIEGSPSRYWLSSRRASPASAATTVSRTCC